MTSFDEQVTSFFPHTETSLVSQSDLTGVLSYHYQASPVSECSSSCPLSFQASLKLKPFLQKKRIQDMFMVITLPLEIF
uniref:Uncharacterized protein n=1 Tax=Brassica oleracea TaxID=3712 RepID=A0A3P6DQE3_BRAOL|nr:unnamed protein product [Brassica oleracea]